MRLRHLRIAAFGPFAEPVEIDFERLNDAGLYLLTGGNGAGKSSILDAVCFALYGAVPGDRNVAKRYRSDHAGPGQSPIVELEASFGDGTYRIVRTAAWERPKRRGLGTTTEQASVSVSRRDGEGWTPVTTRLDEAGHLVTRLVGMNLTQFCQVVVLPQGRFQAFLQSRAEERQALLEQLFHTGRYKRVEQWLRDHKRSLGRESVRHEQAVRQVLSRLGEVAGDSPPDDVDGERVLHWATERRDDLAARLSKAAELASTAAVAETRARAALEAGRELAARLARRRTARAEESALAEGAAAVEDLREEIELARRAAPVAALVPLVRARESDVGAAERQRAAAEADVLARTPGRQADPRSRSDRTVAALRADVARLEALLPRGEEAVRLGSDLAACDREQIALAARAEQLATSTVDADLQRLGEVREQVALARSRLPEAERVLAEVRARLAAHAEVERLAGEHAVALHELTEARARALDRKEVWLGIREARIDGMAAELAGGLTVGCGCPVCGSTDHPDPARSAMQAPDAAAEREAEKAFDDTQAEELAREMLVRDLAGAIERARAATGEVPPATLARTQADATAEVDELHRTLAQHHEVETAWQTAVERRRGEAAETQSVRERVAAVSARRDHLTLRLIEVERELTAALDQSPYDDVAAALADAKGVLSAVESLVDAERGLSDARRDLTHARGALATAALEAGFSSADEAVGALLTTAELDRRVEIVATHDAKVAAVAAMLAEPELLGLDDVEPPDVDALAAAHRAAGETHRARVAERTSVQHGLARVLALGDELAVRVDGWRPVRDELALADRMASFCEGKSPDNRRQMQLSAYVVAWRLGQVAAAANLRLAEMSHGRYSIEHTARRNAGERRGGLGLVVRDDWTGLTRDPVTLSGGETFVVALALALGLADVITDEAGGAALQTLFVDEGFGSLDAAQLDLVLDTLDSLRESGRTVGVVSHVAEMRSRIPVQIQVLKPTDHGPSTVRVRA